MNLFLILLFAMLSSVAGAESQSAVVIVPVADVWSRPLATDETPTDDLRETQVLAGEKVAIHESSGPWVFIEAIEQPTFRQHNKWEGYPGWVLNKVLGPIPAEKKPVRIPPVDILMSAESALGVPYLWGGLSRQGFDCSGLVHLAYRQHEMIIPRDAHEQWMKAKPIKRAKLKPADLIFSAKADNPKIVTHVALYAGDGQIVEAPQAGLAVRKISFQEKYGKALDEVESGTAWATE